MSSNRGDGSPIPGMVAGMEPVHHLARMEDRGLVAKEQCPTDRRGAFVVVTDEGRRQLAAAAPGHVAAVRRLFVDRLRPEQLATLAELAETVLAAFDGDTLGEGPKRASRSRVG